MKHERVTDEYQETAALFALGALTQSEARAFEEHLRQGCSACAAELQSFERVVGTMGFGEESVAPPADLRVALTARLKREAQAPASVIPFPERPAQRMPEAPRVAPRAVPRAPRRNYMAWAVAASLIVFTLASLLAWRESRQAAASAEQLAAAQNEIRDLKGEIAREKQTASELAQINGVLASAGARVIALKGLDPAPSSSARVYWNVQDNRWVVSSDLPPAPAGKAYQLWFVTADAKISAGLIKSDERGHGLTIVSLPAGIARLAAAAITLEPEGGSSQPTMPIYAVGSVG